MLSVELAETKQKIKALTEPLIREDGGSGVTATNTENMSSLMNVSPVVNGNLHGILLEGEGERAATTSTVPSISQVAVLHESGAFESAVVASETADNFVLDSSSSDARISSVQIDEDAHVVEVNETAENEFESLFKSKPKFEIELSSVNYDGDTKNEIMAAVRSHLGTCGEELIWHQWWTITRGSNKVIKGFKLRCASVNKRKVKIAGERQRSTTAKGSGCTFQAFFHLKACEGGATNKFIATYTQNSNRVASTKVHNHNIVEATGFESRLRWQNLFEHVAKDEFTSTVNGLMNAGHRAAKIRDTINSLYGADIDLKSLINFMTGLQKNNDGLSDSAQFLNDLYR